ncbi:MAG: DNA repair protein RecN [Clostridia bacterium]|nr:DNA repair protein RecN [Clostridia bacterium]
MLVSLHIENIALIRLLDLDLNGGFSAFTGETGAGKSILIDAIGLLCGSRGERERIRSGEDSALTEGLFYVPEGILRDKLTEADVSPDEDGNLFIQRRLFADGRGTVKINGRAVPLSKLREIAPLLIHIHGQQDTIGLSTEERQRELLDAYAKNGEQKARYRAVYGEARALRKELEDRKKEADALEEKRDLLAYQANELEQARIRVGEEAELTAEHALLANRERIAEQAGTAYQALYRSDRSAVSDVRTASNALRRLADVLPDGDELLERLDNVKAELTDIAETLEQYAEPGENPAARLQKVEDRLDLLSSLERKYKTDEAGLAAKAASLKEDLDKLGRTEDDLEEIREKLTEKQKELLSTAEELSATRKKAAETLSTSVRQALTELDMPNVRFLITVLPAGDGNGTFGPDGADLVSFAVSANAGEEPKPIGKIASGGELSRMMLCLQFALADAEQTPTMIFDEIDAGISGKTNEKIGRMMARVAEETGSQVICVTHAAQLAARAENHYRISKADVGGRTETAVELLDEPGRISELSRIMGGLQITDAVRKAAAELLHGDAT